MAEQEKKTFYIPPKLNRSYLLAGFKITELIVFMAVGFIAGYLALKGYTAVLSIPAALLVLHCRVLPDGRNVKQLLMMRWRFYKKNQDYSLQECERKR